MNKYPPFISLGKMRADINPYCVSTRCYTELGTLHTLSYLNPITTRWDKYVSPHFTNGKTETQRLINLPMMTKLITGKTDLKLGLPDSKAFNLFAMFP